MLTIAGLIAHRPGDDSCAVTVACNHTAHALHERKFPIRIIGQRAILVILHTVAFDVGFIHHIQAEFRAKLIPRIIIRIVAVAHTVQIELLHQLNIVYHGSYADGASFVRIVFVTVHSLKEHRFSVNHLHAVAHLHRAETKKLGERLQRLSLCIEGADYQCIGIRRFGIPGTCIRENLLLAK